MYTHNIVAFFPTLANAESARSRLVEAGIDQSDMRLSNQGATSSTTGTSTSTQNDDDKGFFEWLFGSDDEVPEYERNWYSGNLSEGRAALSVRLSSDAQRSRVEEILESEGALEVERDDDGSSMGGMTGGTLGHSGSMSAAQTSGAMSSGQRSTGTEEEVIPVVKEELAVGKRQHETRRRIRTHVIERPVSEQVQLRDETIVVERRPATGAGTVGVDGLQEREYEVIERHEEPVVAKRARADEEVVVRKDVRERTETVDDTVRETQVEVEGERLPGDTSRNR
jgi:stress response protein YsnF